MTKRTASPKSLTLKIPPADLMNLYRYEPEKYREVSKNLTPQRRSALNRLMARVEVDEYGNWIDSRAGQGSSQMYFAGKNEYVTRVAWRLWHGDIPWGHALYRGEFRRLSVCPDHMELLTRGEVGEKVGARRLSEIEEEL